MVTGVVAGKPGILEFMNRLWRWQGGIGWILVSMFSPFALFLLSTVFLRVSGGSWPEFSRLATDEYAALSWIGSSLLSAIAYGVGE